MNRVTLMSRPAGSMPAGHLARDAIARTLQLALLLSACGLTSACEQPGQADANPSAPTRSPASVARLQLGSSVIALGTVTQNETARRELAVSNVGTRPLAVERVVSSRFCAGNLEPMTLAPGQVGRLWVTCRADLYGPMHEVIEIHSNDANAKSTKIGVEASIIPLLAFDVPSVSLKTFHGVERDAEVRLVGTLLDVATIRLKEPAASDVDIVSVPLRSTKIRSFRIRCRATQVGTHAGNLFITTGLEYPKEVAIPYSCEVGGTLEVAPTNPMINLKISGRKFIDVTVRSSRTDFRVSNVEVREGPYTASVSQSGVSEYRIRVTALDDRIDDEARAVTGTIVIHSNDRTEPRKEIPILGFGRVNRVERPED